MFSPLAGAAAPQTSPLYAHVMQQAGGGVPQLHLSASSPSIRCGAGIDLQALGPEAASFAEAHETVRVVEEDLVQMDFKH